MRRIGVLMTFSADDAEAQARVGAFCKGCSKWTGPSVATCRSIVRWAGGATEGIRRHAGELVALAPDVIVANGSAAVGPLLQATRTVPIVFAIVPDPVGAGFVDSLAAPGGNATGFMLFEYGIGGKWLELLREIAPGVTRVGVLRDPTVTTGIGQFGAIQTAAPSFGVDVTPINLRDAAEIERAVAAFARSSNGGLIATAQRTDSCASRPADLAFCPVQVAHDLSGTTLCCRRRPDVVWARFP